VGKGEEPSDGMAACILDLAPARGREEKEGGVDPESGGRWGSLALFSGPFSWRPEFVLVFLRHSSPVIFLYRFAVSALLMTIFCARSLNLSSKHIQQRPFYIGFPVFIETI
jgi:hypothetical protein